MNTEMVRTISITELANHSQHLIDTSDYGLHIKAVLSRWIADAYRMETLNHTVAELREQIDNLNDQLDKIRTLVQDE